jgi:16S rRNA processing protein RimM
MPIALAATNLPADAVEVGRIGDAWGIKGWFKVQPYSAQAEALLQCTQWFVQHKVAAALTTYVLPISEAKHHADGLVGCSVALPDRTAAEGLRGARVFLPRASFPALPDGEFYWIDLIGLNVVNREGVALGAVTELLATGAQTVLVLQYTDEAGVAAERMVPYVDGVFVDRVDIAAKCITVDWQPDY